MKKYQAKPAVFLRRMIKALPFTCSCGFKATRYDIEAHEAKCPGQGRQMSLDPSMKEADNWPDERAQADEYQEADVLPSGALPRAWPIKCEGLFGNSLDEEEKSSQLQNVHAYPVPKLPGSSLIACTICNEPKDVDLIYTEVACTAGCKVCVECMALYGLQRRVCPCCTSRVLSQDEVEFIKVMQASLEA
jgi:hypothetical protein